LNKREKQLILEVIQKLQSLIADVPSQPASTIEHIPDVSSQPPSTIEQLREFCRASGWEIGDSEVLERWQAETLIEKWTGRSINTLFAKEEVEKVRGHQERVTLSALARYFDDNWSWRSLSE
jgi:hypothetical protein